MLQSAALPRPKGAGKAAPPPGKAPPPAKAPPGKGPPGKAAGKGRAGPPLPGKAGAARPTGAPRLRPLFWTAVAQVPAESVWSELGEPAPFDSGLLERRFALAEPRAAAAAAAASASGRSSSLEPRKRVRVLDDKTSQLLAIAFNKLPPPEQLAMAVDAEEGFPDGMSAEGLLALHVAATEQREVMEQLRQLGIAEADLSQLDLPERYLWLLGAVPTRIAKLAGAALLVGPARELADVRASLERVMDCCRQLRRSTLLRKCISTSLALGNCLNSGTARGGACAVVLPDSLLKLEELRGSGEVAAGGDSRALSLLDFLARALAAEAGTRDPTELQREAERLQEAARFAKGASLEEAESSCRSICQTAAKAMSGFGREPGGVESSLESVSPLALRVEKASMDANATMAIVESAKAELVATQQWSSAKGSQKGEDWFGAWAQFFEQLSGALGRAAVRMAAPKVPYSRATSREPSCRAASKTASREPSPAPVAAAPLACARGRALPSEPAKAVQATTSEQAPALRAASPAVGRGETRGAPAAPTLFAPQEPTAAAPSAANVTRRAMAPSLFAPQEPAAEPSPANANVTRRAPLAAVDRNARETEPEVKEGWDTTKVYSHAGGHSGRMNVDGASAPPRPPPKEFIPQTVPKRRSVEREDDVRIEDLLAMRSQMAAQGSSKENLRPL